MATDPQRRARLLALADTSTGVGLEVGPLNNPIVLRPDFDVRYVDVLDTAGLRDHYRGDPTVDPDEIPDIDFWLQRDDGTIVGLDEAVKPAAPYRWVVASHVIEHVPDLIGWLRELAEVMHDGGDLVLAIPDKRYCFDVLRPPTTVGQMLQAHADRDRIPSVRAVFDHLRNAAQVTPGELWAGKEISEAERIHDLPYVLHQLALVEKDRQYIDSHVWVFTPAEFAAQMTELSRLGVSDFYMTRIEATEPNDVEFHAILRRIPRAATEAEIAELTRSAHIDVEDRPLPLPVEEQGQQDGPLEVTPEKGVPVADEPEDEAPVSDEPELPPGASLLVVSSREERAIRLKRRILTFARRRRR